MIGYIAIDNILIFIIVSGKKSDKYNIYKFI